MLNAASKIEDGKQAGGIASLKIRRPDPANDGVATAAEMRAGDAAYWAGMGFEIVPASDAADPSTPGVVGVLPEGVIGLHAPSLEVSRSLSMLLRTLNEPPRIQTSTADGAQTNFYSATPAVADSFAPVLPAGAQLLRPGERVQLPPADDAQRQRSDVASTAQLQPLFAREDQPVQYVAEQPGAVDQGQPAAVSQVDVRSAHPVVVGSPLERYSLRGRAPELQALAVDAVPLLGGVALSGQATVIYAKPNAGKTLIVLHLIMEAVAAGRIEAGNVFYVNADDNSSGLAAKARLLDDIGAHTVAPGFQNYSSVGLAGILEEMVRLNMCKGVLVVADTLKKSVNLMRKDDAMAFGRAVRAFVSKGGTFVGLAHVNKKASPNGEVIYAGTSDIVDDFDAACVLTALDDADLPGEKAAKFTSFKRRGDNQDEAFAFASGNVSSYDDLLASVRRIDPERLEQLQVKAKQESDEPIIAAVSESIRSGITKKMNIVREAAKRAGVSQRDVISVVERYQGTDPNQHRWSFSVHAHNAMIYQLLGERPE